MPEARDLQPSSNFVYIVYDRENDRVYFESINKYTTYSQLDAKLSALYDPRKYYYHIYSLQRVYHDE